MQIKLIRDKCVSDAQFGKLYIDGRYFCETMENNDKKIKIGDHAISIRSEGGWYYKEKQKNGYKSQFKGMIEIIIEGRDFILFHPANYPNELRGCVAIAETRDEEKLCLGLSRPTYYKFYEKVISVLNRNEDVSLEITETKKGENKMFNLGFGAIKGIVGNVTGVIEKKEEFKMLKEETAFKIAEAKGRLALAKIEAESQMVTAQSQNDASYDMVALKQKEKTIMDEILSLAILFIFIGAFIPGLQSYIFNGFEILKKTPWFFQFIFIGIFVSTFGLMGLFRAFIKMKRIGK